MLTYTEKKIVQDGTYKPFTEYVLVKQGIGFVMHPVYSPEAYIRKIKRKHNRRVAIYIGCTDCNGKIKLLNE